MRVVVVLISAGSGFILLWPLGCAFRVMNWGVFNPWGLAHGSFMIAWPLLSVLSYRVGSALMQIRSGRAAR